MKKNFYIAFGVSLLVFSLIFAVFDYTSSSKDDNTVNTDVYNDDLDKDKNTEDKKDNKDELLFLMLGVDSNDVDKYSGIRTDTMILSHVNFETGEINLLSIPRDTRVKVRGRLDKINHAHSYDGVDLTLETVRDFLNIDLDYYVKVNYEAVREVVNAIDGVEIDVPRRMKYDDTTRGKEFHVDIKKGLQTLDGDKALEFLRWRKNNNGSGYPGGDVGRVEAQQMFIKELIKQTIDIKNTFKIPKLIKTYYEYVDTNIPLSTMLKSGNMARKIDMESINTNTIPGDGRYINGISYFIYEEDPTHELVEEMFGDYVR